MIAAVTAALAGMRAAAPPGVEVRALADGLDGAAFVVPAGRTERRWRRSRPAACAARRPVRCPRAPTGSSRTCRRGRRSATRAAAATSPSPSGWSARCSAPPTASSARRALAHLGRAPPRELHGTTVLVSVTARSGARFRRGWPVRRRTSSASRAGRATASTASTSCPRCCPPADAVVVLLPLTAATRGLVDAGVLARDARRRAAGQRGPRRGGRHRRARRRAGARRGCARCSTSPTRSRCRPVTRSGSSRSRSRRTTRATPRPADERAIALAAEQLGRFARGEPLANVVRAAA